MKSGAQTKTQDFSCSLSSILGYTPSFLEAPFSAGLLHSTVTETTPVQRLSLDVGGVWCLWLREVWHAHLLMASGLLLHPA